MDSLKTSPCGRKTLICPPTLPIHPDDQSFIEGSCTQNSVVKATETTRTGAVKLENVDSMHSPNKTKNRKVSLEEIKVLP